MMQPAFFHQIQALCRHCPDLVVHGIAGYLQDQPDAMQLAMVISSLPVTSSKTWHHVEAVLAAKGVLSWREVGLCVASAASVYHHMCISPAVELLWTGPDTSMPTRRVEQALQDLIHAASRRILLVTFAAYKMDMLIVALNDALTRQCQVTLILESRDGSEAQLSYDAHHAFVDLQAGARIYHWPLENRPRNSAGRPEKLHAKCAVGDNTLIVSSANLTDDAMSRNMEIGIRLDGGDAAETVWEYYTKIINTGVLQRV